MLTRSIDILKSENYGNIGENANLAGTEEIVYDEQHVISNYRNQL